MKGNIGFKVSLAKIVKELQMEIVYSPSDPNEIYVTSPNVNRPGIELTGFLEFYAHDRLILLGNTEYAYLKRFGSEQRTYVLNNILQRKPPAVIVARNLEVLDELMRVAKICEVPVLRSDEDTCGLIAALISFLNVELAPRITRHGVLVEVYGEGILLTGDSGVGKSETAIELMKRGHRLIADDAVEIRKVSSKSLVGSSPENIRHFVELRGIGIINARRIFGMGSVKVTEKIDMVITMENWDKSKVYDRMGIDNEYTEILDVEVPCLTIPVKPGRNLSIIIEVAAMNNRQKKMGYNAAQELLTNLGMDIGVEENKKILDW
ncbi:MAG: HPr(Ser) kinase/phosphatase [Acutalibacteraceae bacterium]|nr:HPr(Ser) kinase/phosphatase [Acutalibacteraceae bacterium]